MLCCRCRRRCGLICRAPSQCTLSSIALVLLHRHHRLTVLEQIIESRKGSIGDMVPGAARGTAAAQVLPLAHWA